MQDDGNLDQRHGAVRLLRAAVVCAAGFWLAGCASTSVNAQWSDPQFAGKTLRGAKVLVACEAADVTLQRVCAERMAAQLRSLGALPVPSTVGDAVDTPDLLQAARASGASAVMRTSLAPATSMATPGPSIGIGIGGFGGSYRGGGSVGFGVSAPVGGASVQIGYGASASLIDVASGQLIWSANATAPPSSDFNAQMASLAATLLDAARQTGLFAS